MTLRLLMAVIALAALAGCAREPDKQWLKTGPYTSAEFRRDSEACTHGGDLDEACMQAKGWVAVQPDRGEEKQQKKERPAYTLPRAQ